MANSAMLRDSEGEPIVVVDGWALSRNGGVGGYLYC